MAKEKKRCREGKVEKAERRKSIEDVTSKRRGRGGHDLNRKGDVEKYDVS